MQWSAYSFSYPVPWKLAGSPWAWYTTPMMKVLMFSMKCFGMPKPSSASWRGSCARLRAEGRDWRGADRSQLRYQS
eukprot:8909325-Pyramimonas_sp.AAC.1